MHRYMAPEVCTLDIAENSRPDHGYGYGFGGPRHDPNALPPTGSYDGRALDIWSAGVCLYVMLTGMYPFEDENDPESHEATWKNIQSGAFSFPDWISTQARDLITRILQVDPAKRLSSQEICAHPWLQSAGSSNHPKQATWMDAFAKV